jgi:succinate-semialdehyde dehydrogenase/glutarate-semialdehyde dehydrogenase
MLQNFAAARPGSCDVPGRMPESLVSINPATGNKVASYPGTTESEIEQKLKKALRAFTAWKTVPFEERTIRLVTAAAILDQRKDEYSRLMALEMGKPLSQGVAEVVKCASACNYYAENAAQFLAPEIIQSDAKRSYVSFLPIGPLLAVMPWNFPFWQVFRCAAPSMMAGNPVLLKHASNVPGCALAIEQIFREAGYPEGMFASLLIDSVRAGDLVDDRRIAAVTVTGSIPAGRAIAARAGRALKKSVLELGGSDAYLVLEDADLEEASAACTTARLINSGQSCIAGKRFIVAETVRKEFESLMLEKMKSKKLGDPLKAGTDIGPLARVDLRNELHDQVERSVRSGARLLVGGDIPDGPGAYYPATILTQMGPGIAAWDEETFGPVAAIAGARDEDEAITMANNSVFGLGGAVFTRDLARGERIARERLEAGSCFVNTFVRSDPRLPFGGVKHSGYGRELSEFGIREFTNVKTVYL